MGEYHRRLGHPEDSRNFFDQVKSATYQDEDGKTLVGPPYFVELIEEREKIGSGSAVSTETPPAAR